MHSHTQNPAEISPIIKLHLKLLESRFRTVKGSLEMLTVFNHPNLKSAACMIEDCQLLTDAAYELRQAMSNGPVSELEASNPLRNQQHPKDTFEGIAISEHAEESSQFIGMMINNRRGGTPIKEPDWVELREIRQNRDYNRKPATIDGKLIPITTFDNYCDYHIGMTSSQVVSYLKHMKNLGDALFLALRGCHIGELIMRKAGKLSADQKQALLQVAQTGDKAATLQFIDQALQAGE